MQLGWLTGAASSASNLANNETGTAITNWNCPCVQVVSIERFIVAKILISSKNTGKCTESKDKFEIHLCKRGCVMEYDPPGRCFVKMTRRPNELTDAEICQPI